MVINDLSNAAHAAQVKINMLIKKNMDCDSIYRNATKKRQTRHN